MKAVILAAKKKDDLFPFTDTKPTGLIPVAGKPLVAHLIDSLQSIGVDDVYIVTNHLEEMYEERFDEFTNVNTVHQEDLNGTGEALLHCDFIEDDFMVLNSDVIVSTEDLSSLKSKHEKEDSKATVLASDESKPEKFGVLSIVNDKVENIVEKPENAENSLVNTGIYILGSEIFAELEKVESGDLTEGVSSLLENKVRFEIVSDYWYDIGSLKKLWKADRVKRENLIEETDISDEADVHDSAVIDGNAIIKDGARIKSNVALEGDVIIGEDAVIGPNSVVRNSSIGENSQIRAATVEGCLMFEEGIIDPHVHLEHTVAGEDIDIKSGSVITESFLGADSFVEMNNSVRGVKFVPNGRTDLSEISK